MNQSALKGIRVVDFGHVLAGPYGSMLLAEFGAEVIKIETRKRPDEQRVQHGAGASSDYESSSNFFEINLNKLSVSLDLSTAKGSELARRLVSVSDIVLENMRPGVMDKLGLGYKDLVKVKLGYSPDHFDALILTHAEPVVSPRRRSMMLKTVQPPYNPHSGIEPY